MLTLSEVVKVFDVEAFQAGDGDEFRFRLEVVRELNIELYRGKVYRLEYYRLQPTFPQSNGCLPDLESDALIFVSDEMLDSSVLHGNSVQEVVEKFQQLLSNFFGQACLK